MTSFIKKKILLLLPLLYHHHTTLQEIQNTGQKCLRGALVQQSGYFGRLCSILMLVTVTGRRLKYFRNT